MDERSQTLRFLITLAVALLLGGCASDATATPSSAPATPAPTALASAAPATPTPTASATEVQTPAGSHPVIHVNLAVPIASATPLGSSCDVAALQATGPMAATIPGSPLQLFDFNRWDVPPPDPGQTRAPLRVVGERPVPAAGTVVEPISDDPGFPAACRFTFEVPTIADVKTAYAFAVGAVYFPIPLMRRDDLEAAGWVANIGVNPQ